MFCIAVNNLNIDFSDVSRELLKPKKNVSNLFKRDEVT